MTVALPTPDQLRAVAESCGLALTDEDVSSFRGLMQGSVDAYNAVAAMPDEVPIVKYPRTPGYRPAPEENPRNAWYRKSTVKGAATGKLKGKVVALKDNIMLAGVPMMNGSSTLEGFVPDFDATIVTRMLDAGAEIAGKVHCESFCMSGGSHTNSTGPVHNPHKMGYSAGGSSSGSAVVVALGEVDMAIGGDQGGSIRMPSSFSGTYGMKPTWGLVPYTGIMPIEIFVDHTGPMTANVADNALLLEVLAGDDGYDPRIKAPKVQDYTKALGTGVKGLKIAVVREGFEQAGAEAAVSESVREAAKRLGSLGASVEEVSIPMHMVAPAIWMPIGTEGMTQTMMYGDGYGLSRSDLYSTSLMDFHRGWRGQAELAVRDHQDDADVRHLHQQQFRPALLRQGLEHLAPADRGLRQGAGKLRSAADADDADEGDALAGAGGEPRGADRARLRDDHQHRAVRHHPPPRNVAAVRHGGWTAGRPDADRPAFRRADDLSCRACF